METLYQQPFANFVFTYEAVIVQIDNPTLSITFREYTRNEVGEQVNFWLRNFNQLGIVSYFYKWDSTKKQTRDGWEKNGGVRLAISNIKTPVYLDMSKILTVNENKKEIFSLIADNLINLSKTHQKTLIVTTMC